jgi:hypothetical protein
MFFEPAPKKQFFSLSAGLRRSRGAPGEAAARSTNVYFFAGGKKLAASAR